MFEFASEFCEGEGLDIGGDMDRDCVFPGARPINITIDDDWDADCIPDVVYDYIFSSQTLEHLDDPEGTLEYWTDHIRKGGTLFLYLPHPDMAYWRPENHPHHKWMWWPEQMAMMLKELGYEYVLFGERDLYWGFCVVGVK